MSKSSPSRFSRRDLLKLGTLLGGAAFLPSAAASITNRLPTPPDPTKTPSPARQQPGVLMDQLPARIARSRSTRPNVLLLVLDTVRADHLSCYGYERSTTPNLEAFAQYARKYTNTMASGSFTLPNHASLFCGLPVSAHGTTFGHQFLDKRFVTLASLLQNSGYQTAAWSCNSFYAGPRCGFGRGFDSFSCCDSTVNMHGDLGNWFEGQYQPDKPFFIFLNYLDAHGPYKPATEHKLQWASKGLRDTYFRNPIDTLQVDYVLTGQDLLTPDQISAAEVFYDEAIAYLDSKLGQLFRFLARNGLEDNTLLVVTSDHGEHFNEHHLMTHGYSLYEPILRVPLIVRYPKQFSPGEDDRLVQTTDVFATALDVAGVKWHRHPAYKCKSLLENADPSRLGVAEQLVPYLDQIAEIALKYPNIDCTSFLRQLHAVRSGNLKLLVSSSAVPELYDLAKDPLELQNLASERPEDVKDISAKLAHWQNSFEQYRYVADVRTGVPSQTTPEEFHAGKGLGYVH